MSEQIAGQVVPINELIAPPILFKYRELKNVNHLNAIFKKSLYIPCAKEFNDPYDSKIPFRYKEDDLTESNIYKKCLN